MADYGLTLPEHDLTATEFKELARRIGRAAFVPLFLRFYERVITSEASIEEQRKALTDIARWTGVEEDKKVDPNANLPMFNIIFGAPGKPMQAMEVVQEVRAAPDPDPADAMADAALAMIPPDMLAPIMKEMSHAADQSDAPSPADRGLAPAAKPRQKRRRGESAAAGATALPAREPAAGSLGLSLDQVRALGKEIEREREQDQADSLQDALASLDKALGL